MVVPVTPLVSADQRGSKTGPPATRAKAAAQAAPIVAAQRILLLARCMYIRTQFQHLTDYSTTGAGSKTLGGSGLGRHTLC